MPKSTTRAIRYGQTYGSKPNHRKAQHVLKWPETKGRIVLSDLADHLTYIGTIRTSGVEIGLKQG